MQQQITSVTQLKSEAQKIVNQIIADVRIRVAKQKSAEQLKKAE